MLDRRSTTILDGDLTTVLSGGGLPRGAPLEAWVRNRPEDVQNAFVRFVEAGAQMLTAPTRCALPSLDPDWADLADRAVGIALLASGGVPVWAAIGPASSARLGWHESTFDERRAMAQGWAQLAKRCAAAGAHGFALEAFLDTTECALAIAEVHAAVPELPIAASLSPRDDGLLFDGSDPAEGLRVLRKAGATWAGFSGGTGPASIEAAIARAPEADWARPSAGSEPAEAVVESMLRLVGKCWRVGGWARVHPDILAEVVRRNAMGAQPPRNAPQDASEGAL